MAAGRLVKAAARLLDALGEDRCALVGGLAVNAHGYVRATRDVDVIVAVPLSEARRLLGEHGISVRLLRGNPLDGEFSCLKGVVELGSRPADIVPFDVLPQLVLFDPSRAVDFSVRGERLRVVDGETLIRLKLKAGGPKDLHDVAILAHLHPAWRESALALAAAVRGLSERFRRFLDDPRTGAEVRDLRHHERMVEQRTERRRKKR